MSLIFLVLYLSVDSVNRGFCFGFACTSSSCSSSVVISDTVGVGWPIILFGLLTGLAILALTGCCCGDFGLLFLGGKGDDCECLYPGEGDNPGVDLCQ